MSTRDRRLFRNRARLAGRAASDATTDACRSPTNSAEGPSRLTETGQRLSAPSSMHQFEAFYRREFRSVVGLIYALSGSALSEEFAQEAFLEAYRQWEHVASLEKPGAWIRKVALRLTKRAQQRQALEAELLAQNPNAIARLGLIEVSAERAEFWQVVRALPRREAQCLVLRYQADCPVLEIADILGISAGSVKSYLHHGRMHLAKQLGHEVQHGEQP